MRFADDLAEALETRGFGSGHRTPLAEYRFPATGLGVGANDAGHNANGDQLAL